MAGDSGGQVARSLGRSSGKDAAQAPIASRSLPWSTAILLPRPSSAATAPGAGRPASPPRESQLSGRNSASAATHVYPRKTLAETRPGPGITIQPSQIGIGPGQRPKEPPEVPEPSLPATGARFPAAGFSSYSSRRGSFPCCCAHHRPAEILDLATKRRLPGPWSDPEWT